MRPVVHWEDPGLPEKDGVKSTVYEIDFSRDGKMIVVACANLVLVYDVKEGDLIHRLKGHKADVYSVSFIRDGTRFASGGADKTVIIWSIKGEGVLKYTHNDSIQKVAYNQATDQLVSCTASDFGLWSKEQKSVSKLKVFPRVLSCAWSHDGKTLALGHENGKISLRDNKGAERHVIERRDPIFALAWAPPSMISPTAKGAQVI
jgi:intraflagellar transport protein 122